jgi:hypothetical protein
VARDHTTREIRLDETEGREGEVYGTLTDARERLRNAYAAAVQEALVGSE